MAAETKQISEKTGWKLIFSAYALGVAAAVQVGRVAPVAPLIQKDLQIELNMLGWVISLITLASALLGLLAGVLVIRVGLRASLLTGALLTGVCAGLAALAGSVAMVIVLRVIEGVGYLIIVVAAPTLIAGRATEKDAPLALALWGTFFTLGLSIAAFSGGIITDMIGWRGWFLANAGLIVAVGVAATVTVPRDPAKSTRNFGVWKTFGELTAASWLLGVAFLGLSLLALSILSLLPTFLVREHGFTLAAAGSATGIIALFSLAGSLSFGLLAKQLSETMIAACASVILIVSAFPVFSENAEQGQVFAFTACAVCMSGILIAQTFAAVPRVAGAPQLIGPSNGLITQLGSIGALAGPPLVSSLISFSDWRAVPIIVSGFTLSFALLFFLATRTKKASLRKT